MPELPEVETVCRALNKQIINERIKKIIIRQHNLRWPIDRNLTNILPNKIIKAIHRRAKYLLVNLELGHLIIHLGMSGKITIFKEQDINYNNINKHDHIDIILDNNVIIRYNDPRRFGAILWTIEDPYQHKLLINLGLEPFNPLFSAKYLLQQAQNKLTPIKQFIMNNQIVVGVGNIYANEALFAAKINPLRRAKELTISEFAILIKAIKQILKTAIEQGGTTLKDFLNINNQPGYFVQSLKIYGRSKQSCLVCNTIIQETKIAGRSSFFCTNCQPIT